MVRSPLDYEHETVGVVCPRCGPALADKFDGEFICAKCDRPVEVDR